MNLGQLFILDAFSPDDFMQDVNYHFL